MAEMVGGGGGGGKKGGPKSKKKSTKIDMTAMVDVAFLLLTFFVLTATMSNSTLMDLTMPPKVTNPDDVQQDVDEAKVMTIVLCANDTIKYYVGITKAEVKVTNYSPDGIRKAISDHLNRFSPLCQGDQVKGCWDPLFVVKPRYNSRYGNIVDILDEMAITGAKKYAIAEFAKDDSITLNKIEKGESGLIK